MDKLLLIVLVVALGQSPDTELKLTEVVISSLPAECAAEYHPLGREKQKTDTTEVAHFDFDGDNVSEMVVGTGDFGSGGYDYCVMIRKQGKYRKAGHIFGATLHILDDPAYRGLIVGTPCGWDESVWRFWELKNGTLHCQLELQIRYAPPKKGELRTTPTEIKIREIL